MLTAVYARDVAHLAGWACGHPGTAAALAVFAVFLAAAVVNGIRSA